MTDTIIINGRVVDPVGGLDGEHAIIIRDGKILNVVKKRDLKKTPGSDIIDAQGAVVAPGFVDIHVHLREPGYEYKEDIESGCRAAVAGGFTTICCMPNTDPVNDSSSVTSYIMKRAASVGLAKVYPVGAISKGLKGEKLADIGDQISSGVVAFTDDGKPVMNTLLLRRVAEYASSFGVSVMDHCEDSFLSAGGVMNESSVSTELGLKGIPASAEETQVARDIALARDTGLHFHLTHISTAGSVELIRAAKKHKINITADATPHHLSLTDATVRGYDTNTKVNPPLRTAEDVKELVKGLADGTIDAIATDHAPHGIIDKELGYDTAAFGVVGLETALPVALRLVEEKKISLKRMVELLTCGLSKINKGFAAPSFKKGAPADIVVFDPDEKITISAEKFHSKGKNSPFLGEKLKGKVLFTFVDGRLVYKSVE